MPSSNTYFDPSKLAAAIAAQGAGADGRTVLTGKNLLSVLTNVNAPKYVPASQGLSLTSGGEGADPYQSNDTAYYLDTQGNRLSPVDGSQYGDPTGQYFQNSLENPSSTGGKDQAQVTYKINADGTASPVAANNAYAPSAWSDWGRLATELGAVVGTAGLAGYGLAGAGAGGTGGATTGAVGGGGTVGGGTGGSALSGSVANGITGTQGLGAQIGAAAAQAAPAGGGLFDGITAQQALGAVSAAGSVAGAGGGGGSVDSSGTNLFANDSPGNYSNVGGGAVSSSSNLPQSLLDAMKVGGTAVQQWIKANPSLAAGLGASVAGAASGGGSTNLGLPNFNSAAQSQQRSGMVNQTNPYGSSTYTQTGVDAQGNPIYSQNTTLNAQGQSNLNAAQGAQGTAISHLYDQSGAAAAQQAQQASYDKAKTMLDPQWAQQGQALTSSLANQGIGIGSEAYNNAQTNYNNAKTTAYGQAQDSAIAAGNQQQNTLFGQNLTAANGLGGAVQTPTFAAQPAAANYLGAAGLQGQGNINQYNATTGAQNSLNGGLFNLGGSLLGNSNFTSGVGNLFGNLFGSGSSSKGP